MFGTGLALSATPATVAITSALPTGKQGVASAVNDTAREVGSAVGIAILGAALTDTYKSEMVIATKDLPAEIAEKLQSSVAFTQMDSPAPLTQLWDGLVESGLEAFNLGVQASLTIAGWTAIFGAVVIALVAPTKVTETNHG